jgi:hypothetical protein
MAKCGGKFRHKKIRQKSPPQCISKKPPPPSPCPPDPTPAGFDCQINLNWTTAHGNWTGTYNFHLPHQVANTWHVDAHVTAIIGGVPHPATIRLDYTYQGDDCSEHVDVILDDQLGDTTTNTLIDTWHGTPSDWYPKTTIPPFAPPGAQVDLEFHL